MLHLNSEAQKFRSGRRILNFKINLDTFDLI